MFHDYTVSMFRRDVRNGPFAWPGGYPLYFLTSDGDVLCHDCAYKKRGSIIHAIHGGWGDGWRVVCMGVNYEDPECECDHCGERIEPAYPCTWSVVVGNIGTVYQGREEGARECYAEYVDDSRIGIGRAAGETVTLTDPDGDPVLEYTPPTEKED